MLNRPQTSEEAAFSAQIKNLTSPFFPLVGDRLYAQATRLVDYGDGVRLAITVATTVRNSTAYALPYETCTRIRRRVLARLLRDQPALVRRRARALEADQTRRDRPRRTSFDTTIGLARLDGQPIRVGGPTTTAWFDAEGAWMAWPVNNRTAVIGLVPDGVATVHVRSNGGTVKAEVRDNIFMSLIDLPIDRSVPDRLTWTDLNGSEINTITPRVVYSDFERP
ncbi:hypothetical protein [Solirubrobacter soli]|uniref:hypothetical protein n=1 Tax=Solirubrobacter soli TaxID=363832 RepID=UPI0012FBA5C4|nr:hypothetical protein [Solirubrobacter soli]